MGRCKVGNRKQVNVSEAARGARRHIKAVGYSTCSEQADRYRFTSMDGLNHPLSSSNGCHIQFGWSNAHTWLLEMSEE
jgi:hypothetical protein